MESTDGEKGQEKPEEALNRLWQEFLKLRPTNDQLLIVIAEIPAFREKALTRLWEQGATKGDLTSIMVSVPELGETAQKLLNARNRRDKNIQEILEQMKSLKGST